jgi:RNA polymerase sigma-70 factor, ECF subfamily
LSQADKLLDELRRGSQEAYEAVFHMYYGQVFALAYRLLGSAPEADDVAQEAFLRLYLKPLPAGREHNLRAWLVRVATNLGYNALRSRRRRQAHERQVEPETADGLAGSEDSKTVVNGVNRATQDLASESSDSHAAAEQVREVLALMPERQAQILLLRHSGLSYGEVAEAMGIAPGSVGTLLVRAERAFRHVYSEMEKGGHDA